MNDPKPLVSGQGAEKHVVPTTLASDVLRQLGLGQSASLFEHPRVNIDQALKSSDWHVRLQALSDIPPSAVQKYHECLLVMLEDPHPSIRVATLRVLSMARSSVSLERLVEIRTHDDDWRVREAVVRMLGNFQDPACVEPLCAALHDEDEAVRAAAVHALGSLGEDVPADKLSLALQDRSWVVREAAALTFGMLSEQGIALPLEALSVVAHDQDSMVRTAAAQALDTVAQLMSHPTRRSWRGAFLKVWQLLLMQIRLIHSGVWIAPLLVVFSVGIFLFFKVHSETQLQMAVSVLAVFTTAAAACDVPFLYGMKHDAGFELISSTPTSMRLIVFCRFLLVVGYNVLLALGMSVLLALTHHENFLDILHTWLGPMCLLASMALALSSLIGAWGAASVTLLLEASQSIQMKTTPLNTFLGIDFVLSSWWQTNLSICLLTALCLVVALVAIPRQPRVVRWSRWS
ncbi:HEAT repeat domain-containing protein [Ktedonobacter robiniae]|uniref:HEAT repeat domain-containing protein n=1 Tax=Ktedonobacter robiniae TaxID=2778365 RepID=A0ABQ3UGG0_9CHLR|nr:HEAT repeat domain-containing protein [Ktedonobacter robiniae]GHO51791.1 hypothetical protein KSB_02660 [Ktedonobacter robiniae]